MPASNCAHSEICLSTYDEGLVRDACERAAEQLGGRCSCIFVFVSPDWRSHLPDMLEAVHDRKYVSIRSYGGEPRVNIRQYIHDSHGRPYSTKRGILLTPTEWQQLKKNFKDIDNCLRERIK